MGDPRLMALFDSIGQNLKEVIAYKEELRIHGIKAKDAPAISHDPVHQVDDRGDARYSPALSHYELGKYRKMCPSGWFTEKEMGEAIDAPDKAERICFWLKRKALIRFSPQVGKYRKAYSI